MKLSPQELEALCEYVDGRRAALVSYDDIAEELVLYTTPLGPGEDPRLTAKDLDWLELWHKRWVRRQQWLEKQRIAGDARGGSRIAEMAVDWSRLDNGALRRSPSVECTGEPLEADMARRVEALRSVMYLRRSLLKAKVKWVYYKTLSLHGVEWEERTGPGSVTMADGSEAEWRMGAVILRRREAVVQVMEECRKRGVRPAGWKYYTHPSIEVERLELDGEKIDVRDLSSRLAVLIHTTLGAAGSPFRNNEHLAKLLGVTREAMRVRKKRIMKQAGMRSAEGMAPNRGNGGRATQARKAVAAEACTPTKKSSRTRGSASLPQTPNTAYHE